MRSHYDREVSQIGGMVGDIAIKCIHDQNQYLYVQLNKSHTKCVSLHHIIFSNPDTIRYSEQCDHASDTDIKELVNILS